MRKTFGTLCIALGLSACSVPSDTTSGEMKTVTVNGKSYDVFFDPYEGDHAIIFGKRPMDVFSLPKAEIVAQGTPCELDKDSMIAFQHSDMTHPSRPDLENLGWVPLDCSES